jgi:tetratricopeptide (TPR) repeat protein
MSGLLVVFLYLLAADPTSRDHLQRATELVNIGRPEAALPYFAQAIKLRLDNPDSWMGRGRALVTLGRYRDAIDDFDEAVRLEPATSAPPAKI